LTRVGIQGFQARKIAFNLGLSGEAFKQMTKFVVSLYNAYDGIDASMFEINPVLKLQIIKSSQLMQK
jgi:succinyl-CoA synthetase beta subunit